MYDEQKDLMSAWKQGGGGWLDLLDQGIKGADILGKSKTKDFKKDPSLLVKGFAANQLNQYLKGKMPNKLNIDLKEKELKYSPTEKMTVGLGKDKFSFDWKF